MRIYRDPSFEPQTALAYLLRARENRSGSPGYSRVAGVREATAALLIDDTLVDLIPEARKSRNLHKDSRCGLERAQGGLTYRITHMRRRW